MFVRHLPPLLRRSSRRPPFGRQKLPGPVASQYGVTPRRKPSLAVPYLSAATQLAPVRKSRRLMRCSEAINHKPSEAPPQIPFHPASRKVLLSPLPLPLHPTRPLPNDSALHVPTWPALQARRGPSPSVSQLSPMKLQIRSPLPRLPRPATPCDPPRILVRGVRATSVIKNAPDFSTARPISSRDGTRHQMPVMNRRLSTAVPRPVQELLAPRERPQTTQ